MRITVNLDARLLAAAKSLAAREHRTLGSVLDQALRRLIDAEGVPRSRRGVFRLHTFEPERAGVIQGVDLEDKDLMAKLLGDCGAAAPA